MLVVFALFSELIYLFLLIKARSFGILDLHNNEHLYWVLICLMLLFIAYFLVLLKINWQNVSLKTLALVILLFHLTFLLTPFLSSNDLYSYIFTTRINGLYGENPYFITYNSLPQDPLHESLKTVWAEQKTLYGPLFLYIGGLINVIGQNNLTFLTLAFKSLFIAANLAGVYLIFLLTKSKKAIFLYAANPLVVFELSGNSHTESLTLLLLLLAFYWISKYPVLGFLSFTASVLIKFYPLVFLPLFLVALQKFGAKILVTSLALGVLVTILVYLPFWQGPDNFSYLMTYYNGRYDSHSLLIYPLEIITGSYLQAFQINTMIFLIIALVLSYKFWSGKTKLRRIIFYSFILYWVYLLTKSSLILSWYLILLVLLGSLCMSFKEYQKYALASIGFVSIYSLLIYYFVR